jgi:hypothetical protein
LTAIMHYLAKHSIIGAETEPRTKVRHWAESKRVIVRQPIDVRRTECVRTISTEKCVVRIRCTPAYCHA